jgi:hypothetical protein
MLIIVLENAAVNVNPPSNMGATVLLLVDMQEYGP